ncbi:MAG: ABC transporter permease [Bacteroidota bacterium]
MDTNTEYRKAWQRFRSNKPAHLSLYVILFALMIACFGYILAPDGSPDANEQLPALALQPAGKMVQVLEIPISRNEAPPSWFSCLLSGKPLAFRAIPIEAGSLVLRADSVYFRGFGAYSRPQSLHLVQLYAVTPDSVRNKGDTFFFQDAEKKLRFLQRSALVQQFDAAPPLSLRRFPLGTDKYGRCMLSRLILGFRVSLLVGSIAVLISLTVGLCIGAIGGYFRGRVDDVVMLLINTVWSIPTLLLVFAVVLALGRGISIIFLAVGLTMWVDVARVVRGQVMALRDLPFVEAARTMGFSGRRILFRHIVPNLLGPVMVLAAGNFATAILLESGLSYLGFGVQPPTPSWGSMLNENYGYAIGGKPLLALAPALVIALTVLAFNLVGNGLRDALDVRNVE